jgi:hypothetical protein
MVPDTNPAPFTVSVNPGAVGSAAAGTSGCSINGTGFCATHALAANNTLKNQEKRKDLIAGNSSRESCAID